MERLQMSNKIEEIKKELKRVASVKCRLKKMKGKVGTIEKLQEIEEYENSLKAQRDSLMDRKKYVTEFEWEDIQTLDYEEVSKAINSIKSKKSLSRWLSDVEGDNDEYRNAVRIEEMLYKRKEELGGSGRRTIKVELQEILESCEQLSKEELIAKLQELL
jgi:hypothetical protein